MYTAQIEAVKKQMDVASKLLSEQVQVIGQKVGQTAVQLFSQTSNNVGTIVANKTGQAIPGHIAQAITAGALCIGIGGSFYLVVSIKCYIYSKRIKTKSSW